VDILTAHENGTSELQDSALLDCAAELDRVLFTQDDGLLVMDNAAPAAKVIVSWCDLRAPAPCIDRWLHPRLGACSKGRRTGGYGRGDALLAAVVGDADDLSSHLLV
jgi:hypothetical protein